MTSPTGRAIRRTERATATIARTSTTTTIGADPPPDRRLVFLAVFLHVRVDRALVRCEGAPAPRVEGRPACERAAGPPHERREQIEFGGREPPPPVAHAHAHAAEVDLDVGGAEHL